MTRAIRNIVFAAVLCLATGPAARGQVTRTQCQGDFDGDGAVAITEIITAVNNALNGCSAILATPTPDVAPTATPTVTVSGGCQSSTLALSPETTVTCIGSDADRLDGCATVRLDGTCSPGRACAPATATCSCVGGPLGGVQGACTFQKIPGGISCHGICTGSCVISIGDY